MAWCSNPSFTSKKPTHYLLDYRDFLLRKRFQLTVDNNRVAVMLVISKKFLHFCINLLKGLHFGRELKSRNDYSCQKQDYPTMSQWMHKKNYGFVTKCVRSMHNVIADKVNDWKGCKSYIDPIYRNRRNEPWHCMITQMHCIPFHSLQNLFLII